jgi:hypothetical protein
MKVFSRVLFVWVCVLAVFSLTGEAAHAALSADDFLPPAQAEAEQQETLLAVKDETSVKTEVDPVLKTEVTSAPTLQDAINKVIAKPQQGCRTLAEPGGGYAFVATGMGAYKSDYQNVNAARVEQRNAYLAAFMNAKAEMAKTVGEIVVRGATNFDEKLDSLDTETTSLTNVESQLSEEQLQSVRKVLKGYVTYAVKDTGKGLVYVTIVSSSKTRGKFSRNGTDGVSAANLREGLNSVISEIKNGFVPPVGGRIIEVPGTGEVAFVGFGSSVVRYDREEDVQERLKLQAEQVASMRATDALAGIILGDDTTWMGKADATTQNQVKDFERQQASDQTAKGSEEEVKAYEQRKRSLRSESSLTTNTQSLRQGVLPPGVIRETSLDDDEYFAYGIAVYIPSLSEATRNASKEMDDAQLVQPPKTGGAAPEKEQKSKPELKQGPSGVVQQNL